MAKRIIPCPKCNATGKLPHFMHVDNGRCFMCAGAKTIEVDDSQVRHGQTRQIDPAHELRNMYRAARSQVPGWMSAAEWLEDGTAERIAYYLRAVDAPTRERASAAFAGLLGAAWSKPSA